MHTHCEDRKAYEDRYDRLTVGSARRGMAHYESFFSEIKSRLEPGDTIDRPGNALVLNLFYMQAVGDDLIRSYEERDETVREWMASDEAKDRQLADARLTEEPVCRHCKKVGLRIIDRSLMRRGDRHDSDDTEYVLLTLQCSRCKKNTATWEDSSVWIPKPTLCPKCDSEMTSKTNSTKKALTFAYTCPSCKHSYKDAIDLSTKKTKPNPDYEVDRIHFCLEDIEFRNRLFTMKRDLERMAEFDRQRKEKDENKHIYDAVAKLRKLTIAEIAPLLQPALDKAGYGGFGLDTPEMGKNVYLGFNCLDTNTQRQEYTSRKDLEKLIKKTLVNTNWRLMSDGISYRLGYLSGRIRAYESVDDLKQLVEKDGLAKPETRTKQPVSDSQRNRFKLKGKNSEDIIL